MPKYSLVELYIEASKNGMLESFSSYVASATSLFSGGERMLKPDGFAGERVAKKICYFYYCAEEPCRFHRESLSKAESQFGLKFSERKGAARDFTESGQIIFRVICRLEVERWNNLFLLLNLIEIHHDPPEDIATPRYFPP